MKGSQMKCLTEPIRRAAMSVTRYTVYSEGFLSASLSSRITRSASSVCLAWLSGG